MPGIHIFKETSKFLFSYKGEINNAVHVRKKNKANLLVLNITRIICESGIGQNRTVFSYEFSTVKLKEATQTTTATWVSYWSVSKILKQNDSQSTITWISVIK